jgi:RNA polymerase sigma factor (sigma-70 family)
MKPTRLPPSLTRESWDRLFDFLDPNRRTKTGANRDSDAEAKYREIMRKLIFFFASRTCADADDLAVETIVRVAAKCGELPGSSYNDPTGYFYAVARHVHQEWVRKAGEETHRVAPLEHEPPDPRISDSRTSEIDEVHRRCLDKCLDGMNQRARRLILAYYTGEKAAKIEGHQKLADELGKTVNGLRIEVYRIMKMLRGCVIECTQPGPTAAASGWRGGS